MNPEKRNLMSIHTLVRLWMLSGGFALLAASNGCGKEDPPPPPMETGPITAHGVTLDENATPQEVTFVLLRTLADDMAAARAGDREGQRKALEDTFALAAHDEIERRLLKAFNEGKAVSRESLGANKAEDLMNVIKLWTPIVGYYVESFDTELDHALKGMSVVEQTNTRTVIHYVVRHVPTDEHPEPDAAILAVELAPVTAGGKDYWRVLRVYFAGPAAPGTRPASAPAA